jgi:superfamily II DNA or RNA helicase
MTYEDFLETKQSKIINSGFVIEDLNKNLFPFQNDIVKYMIKRGKIALFSSTGTGKTQMEAEWLYQIQKKENKPVLILCPLAVAEQWKVEVKKILGYESKIIEKDEDVFNGINIINYEKIHKIDTNKFIAVALDESSILKNFSGKVKQDLIEKFETTKYKLAATATPAPNDYEELGNHAEFLNVMKRNEMLSMFFIHDSGDTAKWRLKGHGKSKFWEWIASWAVVLNHPRDLGYEDIRYDLPKLNMYEIFVENDYKSKDRLFHSQAKTLNERREARRQSLKNRTDKASEIANNIKESPVLIWCDLNSESEQLKKKIINAVEVKGSDKEEHKKNSLLNFGKGEIKALVSKPSIAGMGLNFQVCNNMIFTGLSDSFEQFYQAVRRCWRFGQTKEVNVYIISSTQEGSTLENIKRKQKEYEIMIEEMKKYTIDTVIHNLYEKDNYKSSYSPEIKMKLPKWIKGE